MALVRVEPVHTRCLAMTSLQNAVHQPAARLRRLQDPEDARCKGWLDPVPQA